MGDEFKKAVVLFENNKIKQAKEICIKIYKKNPKHFDNLRLLNFIYFKKKNFSKALNIINEAIKVNPNFAEAHNEQGNALNELKQLNMALKSYDNAIKINPKFSDAYYNKAVILHELKNIELAIENYDNSIKINPNHIHAHNNKGFALQQLKKFDESLKSYNRAYKINSNFNFLLGKIFHTKNLMCNWESYNDFLDKLKKKISDNSAASLPFNTISLYDLPSLQKKNAETFIKKTFGNINNKIISKIPKNKKIRIGYYSADFYSHAMSLLLVRMFELHDKSKFEVIAFSFGPEKNDEISKRIKNAFDQFIKVNLKTDKEIADSKNLLRTILKAAYFTDKESIFVVGIPPYFPSTSYGYLSSEGNLENDDFLRVRQFIEKPNYKKASELFKKKGIFWNSGNSIAEPSALLAACSKFVPKVLDAVELAFGSFSSSERVRLMLDEKNFKECMSISKDPFTLFSILLVILCMLLSKPRRER